MSLTTKFRLCLFLFIKKYVTYSDKSYRLTRKEFSIGFFTIYLVSQIPSIALYVSGKHINEIVKLIFLVVIIVNYITSSYIYVLIVTKRLYDADVTYWFVTGIVIPILNIIVFAICFLKASAIQNKNFPDIAKIHIIINTCIVVAAGSAWLAFSI